MRGSYVHINKFILNLSQNGDFQNVSVVRMRLKLDLYVYEKFKYLGNISYQLVVKYFLALASHVFSVFDENRGNWKTCDFFFSAPMNEKML